MAFNLMSLLQQAGSLGETPEQIAARAALEAEQGVNPNDVINVTALQPNVEEPASRPPLRGNQQAQIDAREAISNPPEHRGAFGLRGLLREIIGRVGDYASVNQGGEATYAQQRNRENISDAMLGFTGGNEDALAAAERVTATGNYDVGRQLAEQAQQEALRRAQLEGVNTNNAAMNENRAALRAARATPLVSRVLANPAAYNNGVITPEAYRVIQSIASANGVDPASLGITPEYTEAEGSLFGSSDLSVNNRMNFPLKQEQVEIARDRAATARIAATRPRAISTPNPTQASEIARMTRIINEGGTLSRGDQQVWDRYMRDVDSDAPRSVTRQAPATITSSSGRRFTPVN